MTVTSLDFSRRAELQPIGELVGPVSMAADRLGFHCFITGALARDLWIVHQFGIETGRQTGDADFAMAVPDWESFHALRRELTGSGRYTDVPGARIHRLRHRNGTPIDLIPFGGVERQETRSIAWPPDNAFVMSVFGLREAASQAVEARFPGDAVSRVATLPALALLKIDAWADRHLRAPGKDAHDLMLIARQYLDFGNFDRAATEFSEWFEDPDFDYVTAGARLLGHDIAGLLDRPGREKIAGVLAGQSDEANPGRLSQEMSRDAELAVRILSAMLDGLLARST